MASILLNTLFYPDIVNIILDYVMVGKDIARQIKNVNMDYLVKLSHHIMITKNRISSKLLLKKVKFYREVNKSFLLRMSDI
jgi:hypothetical protein